MEEIIEVVEEISLGEVELILIEIEKHGGHCGRRHPHLVCVTVDGEEKQVRAGRYRVAVQLFRPLFSAGQKLQTMAS